MAEPIDGLYFNWLRAKVLDYETPSYLYLDLLNLLYRTPFVYTLIGDENRKEDGLELRYNFLMETGIENDPYWHDSPCSVLEVLLALCHRACFVTEIPIRDWFWMLITNLRLDSYKTVSKAEAVMVNRIIETWLFRMYDYSGYGGLFPLHEPDEDQTRLELYYQMNRYLDDQGL